MILLVKNNNNGKGTPLLVKNTNSGKREKHQHWQERKIPTKN